MPIENSDIRTKFVFVGESKSSPAQTVVVTTILKFLSDTRAYLKQVIWSDGHVAKVKQTMNISTEEESI